MAFRRPIRPPFNSFSRAAAECLEDFSDSEYNVDETWRAAKRRRIERLGQDYLEGKPLFILSAGLKGPFGNGWVNPWSRQGEGGGKSTETRRSSSEAVAIPETTPRRLHHHQTVVPSSNIRSPWDRESHFEKPAKPFNSGSLYKAPKSNNIQNGQRKSSSIAPSRASSKHSTSERGRAVASHRSTDDSWLKKDQRKIHSRVINPPTSPSPTPAFRCNRSERQASSAAKQRRTVSPVIFRTMKPASFTPINGHCPMPGNNDNFNWSLESVLETHSFPSENASKRRLSKDKAISVSDFSQFLKPAQPACTLLRRDSSNLSNTLLPAKGGTEKVSQSSKGQRRSKSGSPQNAVFEVPHDTGKSSESHTLHPSDVSQSKQGEDDLVRNVSTRQTAQHSEGSFLYNSVHDPGTLGTYGSDVQQSAEGGSEEITSAQIVPGNSKLSNPTVSLNSTTFAQQSHFTEDRRRSLGYGGQLSTQAAVSNAQRLLQEDIATPVREDIRSSAQAVKSPRTNRQDELTPHTVPGGWVQPNRVSDITGPVSTHKTPNGVHATDTSTQAMVNAITPYSFDTAKKMPPTFPNIRLKNRNEATDTVDRVSTLDHCNHRTPPDDNNQPTGQTHGEQNIPPTNVPDIPIPFPEMQEPQQQQHDDDDDNISSRYSSTVLPFNLTGSTTGTKQDGQGGMVVGLDDFDLQQAIMDAGSFLHWDIEQDLSRCSEKAGPGPSSPSGATLQSILRPDAVQRS